MNHLHELQHDQAQKVLPQFLLSPYYIVAAMHDVPVDVATHIKGVT